MNPKIDNGMPRISLALIVLFVLAMLVLLQSAHAQESDIFVSACATQDACTLQSNVPWSVGARTWRFTAKYPNESIRVWIRNQNTTSAHSSQTVSVFITDDKTATSLLTQADRWLQASVTDNNVSGSQCSNVAANAPTATPGANGKATCYINGMYAVQVAVRITGAAGAAGSPDQFDIGIVQEQSFSPGGPQPGQSTGAGDYNENNRWRVFAPGTAGAAITATQPAVSGVTHVADCVGWSTFALVAPAAASADTIQILDGATAIWQLDMVVPATIGTFQMNTQCGLNIPAGIGNSMSCKMTNATANAAHSCNLIGYDRK